MGEASALPQRPIRRWAGVRKIHNFLRRRVRLPRAAAERLSHRLARIQVGDEVTKRRRLARELGGAGPVRIPEELGWTPLSPELVPSLGPAAAACRALYQRCSLERADADQDKAFFALVAHGEELLSLPAVRELVFSDAIVSSVSRYLGELPVLGNVDLMLTPPNESCERSQKFHFDFMDSRQIKLLLNVTETTESRGPFTFLPADRSAEIAGLEGYGRGRLSDEAIRRHGAEGALQRLTGPAGGGALVDTSRCLHYGSRGNREPRLLLFVQYLSLLAPELTDADWADAAPRLAEGLGADQRRLLRLG